MTTKHTIQPPLLCHTAQDCASVQSKIMHMCSSRLCICAAQECASAQPKTVVCGIHVMWHREGSANSDMGSRASLRDDDIAQAEVMVESARQAVGEFMRKIEQVGHATIAHTKLSQLRYAVLCAKSVSGIHVTKVSAHNCTFA